ncbi:SDR family oxidoreductase [Chryseobacterium oryctis]|uniref:SDR family oxidoreductase n=1 Tax=Chryseobacterium oryctis TaxID=2952618 RepID=A0ABT3HPW6_9FLAO|nr:SDR family oxidoreductase [Chryseobacterium oryctis]MCW3161826.1 SDR family oxidoreductase [Chryseobacterium oryctis]
MNFSDKIILITGGASGIGKIMGRKALERGVAKLVIWDINEKGLHDVKSEFENYKGEIFTYKVDVSNLESIQSTADLVKKEVGNVEILINNAGIVVGKYFHEHTHDDIKKTTLINSDAMMHITLEFLTEMINKNNGSICNIASAAGLISNPKMSVYAASKWAVIGWSDSMRLEMKELKKNVAVTTVMPFYINTGMFEGIKSKLVPILEPEPTAEKIIRAIEKKAKMLAMPLPYWYIRLNQGVLPLNLFDWVMRNVFGIYDTMKDFKGR